MFDVHDYHIFLRNTRVEYTLHVFMLYTLKYIVDNLYMSCNIKIQSLAYLQFFYLTL